jgi:acyl-coenzyme A synthetase/AMP-(fatty) acid ligase
VNIVDPVLFQCRYHPPAAAICTPGSGLNLVSYARLERLIHNASRMAVAAGLQRGNTVAIFVEDAILNAAVVLGLTRIGVVTLAGRRDVPKDLTIDAVLTDRIMPQSIVAARVILVDANWTAADGQPLEDRRLYETNDNDVCRIILTSGTTGEPKAVALTHRMLANRIARHPYLMGNRLSHCDRIYCDFGLGTSLGFQFLIYVLWRGGTIVLGGQDHQSTIQSFDLYKIQALIGSPACLASFTKFYEQYSQFQSSFELAMVGGSQLSPSLSQRARACLCPNIVAAYGATETSMVATAPARAIEDAPGAVGYVTPDMSVEIVDQAGRAVAPGQEGLVRVRGPYSVDGYYGRQSEDSAFQNGWFYPGDMGSLRADNLLLVSGREQTVVNIGGDKMRPEALEAVLIAFPGVEDAAVLSMKNDNLGIDQLWGIVVPRTNYDEKALEAYCLTKFPRSFVPARFVTASELPRNEMGKIDRQQLSRLMKEKLKL